MKYAFLLLCVSVVVSEDTDSSDELVHSMPYYEYLLFAGIALALVLFGGMMSGLTVGMMSLDELELQMKLAIGTPEERNQAELVLPIINRHHLLLVTLLLANAAAMETLPIILCEMFAEGLAIALSVTFVLIFGEVIPQALCTGPDQMKIACRCIPIVKFVICFFLPLSYPISVILDHCFQEEDEDDDTEQLIDPAVDNPKASSESHEDSLNEQQVKMIHAAIQSRKEVVADHMIPMDRVFSISSKTVLNNNTLLEIRRKGFSRVPVYKDNNTDHFIGILLVKRLLAIDANESMILEKSQLELRQPVVTFPSESLLNLLDDFEHGRSHMAIVVEHVNAMQPEDFAKPDSDDSEQYDLPQRKVLGIITLENVLEQLLKISIFDEEDFDHQHHQGEKRHMTSISRKRVFGHMPVFSPSAGQLFRNQASLRSPAVQSGLRSLGQLR